MRQIKWGKVTFLNIYKQSKSINKQTNKQTNKKEKKQQQKKTLANCQNRYTAIW